MATSSKEGAVLFACTMNAVRSPMAAAMRMHRKPGFDVMKDFVHVGRIALSDLTVVVPPEAAAAVRPAAQWDIAQTDKRFVPTVSVLPVGSAVNFPNRDTVRHHVYSFSQAKTFELKLYIGTPANPVVFDRPGVAVLGCNIHDTMVAWVLVVETPYFGRTDAAGRLRLDSAPPGSYRLRVWHPALPPGAPASDEGLQLAASGTNPSMKSG